MNVDDISEAIVKAATKVRSELGPGLLESEYEDCLLHELVQLGLEVKAQVILPDEHGEVKKKTVIGLSISCESDGESSSRVKSGKRITTGTRSTALVLLKAVSSVVRRIASQRRRPARGK